LTPHVVGPCQGVKASAPLARLGWLLWCYLKKVSGLGVTFLARHL
jgi:hypothetical protein